MKADGLVRLNIFGEQVDQVTLKKVLLIQKLEHLLRILNLIGADGGNHLGL